MQIKNPSLLTKLEKSGFSDKEALVYVSVLELGGAFPSRIAEYSGLNRSTVYKILLNLSVRGIVNEIEKKNKLFYQIEKPQKILRYIQNKIDTANDELEQTKRLIPDLEGMFSAFAGKPKISYFENLDGVTSVYEDQINTTIKYEMLAFSNASEFERVFPVKFFENYRRTKERIGITTRGILPDTEEDATFIDRLYGGYKKEVIPTAKFIPASEFPFKGEIVIYGENKVSIVNLNKEHLTGLIIEDETIHKMMKMIFELSWAGIK